MITRNIFKFAAGSLLILLAAASCTERIDVDVDQPEYERLVVEGHITNDPVIQTVRLTKTSSYFENQPAPVVSGASVQISFGGDVLNYTESATDKGLYSTTETFTGIIGTEYTLNIQLSEPVGGINAFEGSALMKAIEQEQLDSITMEYRSDFEFWLVNLYGQEPPSTDWYMFNAEVNGRLVTDTVTRTNVSDDIFFNGSYAAGVPVLFLRKEEVKVGDTVTLIMSAIEEDFANFLWEMQDEVNFSTPLFSGPPANISTNLSEGALGYFAAYSNARLSTVVREEWAQGYSP